jgi:uncharacterized membrane protein
MSYVLWNVAFLIGFNIYLLNIIVLFNEIINNTRITQMRVVYTEAIAYTSHCYMF